MPVVEVDDAFRSITAFADSTVQFFRRRAELEASYLEGLEKILAKQEESDRKAEQFFRDSTLLAAWTEVKSIAYQELNERKQTIAALQKGVVDPLSHFRDQKDRQRKRIKEELSNRASEHNDYKAHTLRLKRVYQRRSEEVRHLSAPSTSNTHAADPGSPPPTAHTSEKTRDAAGGLTSSPGTNSGTNSGPQTPSGQSGSSRDILISGATSTVLRDAQSPPPVNNPAMHAIKSSRSQLNSLITKLGGGTSRTAENLKPSVLQTKLSKARREAEESDASYRSALHHLETLRMQRERVSKASVGSLHEFCFELSTICKSIFAQYCDSWSSKARQTEIVTDRAKSATYAISPEHDVSAFNRTATVNVFFEDPLPYENYHVGISYSLIFGVSLSEYTASNDGVLVPLTVQRAILEVDSRGLDIEGIYRIPGKMGLIQQVVQEIEQDEFVFEFDPDRHDVHTVAGVLKLYLRQLPEALFPIDSKEREVISAASDEEANQLLSRRLRKMTASHQATAKMLIAHFARVLSHSATNKMSPSALATCLNPVLFPEESNLNAFAQGSKDRCLHIFITQRQELFSGLPVLDNANNPYRNPRLSSSTGGFEDEDDDPPYRKSQESVKLPQSAEKPVRPSLAVPSGSGLALDTVNLAFPPRSTSFQASSGEPTPVVYSSPGYAGVRGCRPSTADPTTAGTYSAPMSITQSRSSQVSSASATGSEAFLSSPDFRKNTTELRPVNLSQSASSTSSESAPRRSLSQRAKVGSAQIAHAVKSIARSRSGSSSHHNTPNAQSASHILHPLPSNTSAQAAMLYSPPTTWQHPAGAVSPLREAHAMEFGSPTSSGDSHQPVPPLQTSRPTSTDPTIHAVRSRQGLQASGEGLPAGAALLVARPASLAASSPPSNLPTPDAHLLGQVDNPLFADPQVMQGVPHIDPDAVYAEYHKKEARREDNGKKRASTD